MPVDQDSAGASAAVPPAPYACVSESPKAEIAVGGEARAAGATVPATTTQKSSARWRAWSRNHEVGLQVSERRAILQSKPRRSLPNRDLAVCLENE